MANKKREWPLWVWVCLFILLGVIGGLLGVCLTLLMIEQ